MKSNYKVTTVLSVLRVSLPKKQQEENWQNLQRFLTMPCDHALFSTPKCFDIPILYIAWKNRHILV